MVAADQQNGISGTPRHAGLESGGTSCSSIRCVYDVLEDGAVVRRIFLSPVAPADKPWMWASGRNRQIRPTATSRRARLRCGVRQELAAGNSPALPLASALARIKCARFCLLLPAPIDRLRHPMIVLAAFAPASPQPHVWPARASVHRGRAEPHSCWVHAVDRKTDSCRSRPQDGPWRSR